MLNPDVPVIARRSRRARAGPCVVANEFEKFNWNMCPPARFSIAKLPWWYRARSRRRAARTRRPGRRSGGCGSRPPRPSMNVVVVVDELGRQRVGVVHPDRLEVHGADVAESARDDRADAPASSCPGSCSCRRSTTSAATSTGMPSACRSTAVLAEELESSCRGSIGGRRSAPFGTMPNRYSRPMTAPLSRPNRSLEQVVRNRPRRASARSDG